MWCRVERCEAVLDDKNKFKGTVEETSPAGK